MKKKLKKTSVNNSENSKSSGTSGVLSAYEKINNLLKPIPREKANVEAEKGETVLTDKTGDNVPELYSIGGKKHTQGGTPLDLPIGSFVFSDTPSLKIKDKEILKEFGEKTPKTPAEISRKYLLNKDKAIVLNEDEDEITRNTALYRMEGKMDKLSKIALLQESMKGFPDGLPKFTYPYLIKNGIDPKEIEAEAEKQRLLEKAKSILQSYRSTNKSDNPNMQDGGLLGVDTSESPLFKKTPSLGIDPITKKLAILPAKTSFSEFIKMRDPNKKPGENYKWDYIKGEWVPIINRDFLKVSDKSKDLEGSEKQYISASFSFGFNPYEKMAMDQYLAAVHNADQQAQYRNIQESGIVDKGQAASMQDKGDYVAAGSQYGFYRPNEVTGSRFYASSPYASYGMSFSKYGGLVHMEGGGQSDKEKTATSTNPPKDNNPPESEEDKKRKEAYKKYFDGLLDEMKRNVIQRANDIIDKSNYAGDKKALKNNFEQFVNDYYDDIKKQSDSFVGEVYKDIEKEGNKSPGEVFNILTIEAQNHTNPFYSLLSNQSYSIIGRDVLKKYIGEETDKGQLLDNIYGINNPNSGGSENAKINEESVESLNKDGKVRRQYAENVLNPVADIAKTYLDNYLNNEDVVESLDIKDKDAILKNVYLHHPFIDENGKFVKNESILRAQDYYLKKAKESNITPKGVSVSSTASDASSEITDKGVYFSKPDGIYGAHTSNQSLLVPNIKKEEKKEEPQKQQEKKKESIPEVKVPDVKVPEVSDKMPFFIQDKNNLAAALYNLGSIKKYYPIFALPQYTAPTPSYYDYRRQEANIQEAGNLAAKSYQSLLPSQVAAAAIASGASSTASQAANAVANVQNQNTQIRNQYSQNLANIFNTLSERAVAGQQDYRNKLVTMQQQYDNARRQALGALNIAYNTALTNAANAYNYNLAHLDSPFSINPSRGGAMDVNKEKLEDWYDKNKRAPEDKLSTAIAKVSDALSGKNLTEKEKAEIFPHALKYYLGEAANQNLSSIYNTPVNQGFPGNNIPYMPPTMFGSPVGQQGHFGYEKGGNIEHSSLGSRSSRDIISKVKSILSRYQS